MKILELSSGFFALVKTNREFLYFEDFKDLEKEIGFNKTFELFMNSVYLNLSNFSPTIFSLGFDQYKICFPSGRVEFITSSNKDFLSKFQNNYKLIEGN
jgi:hypothetical protein